MSLCDKVTTGKLSRLDRVSVVLPLLVGGLGGREDLAPGDGLMRSLSTTAASTETNNNCEMFSF